MVSASDKAVPVLYRAVVVVCVFLVFGMVLNGVVMNKERLMEEKSHQTAIRIALIREEYQRKISDLRLKYKNACEESVQEVVLHLKQVSKETIAANEAKLRNLYENQFRNQSDEIDVIKEELKRISSRDLTNGNGGKPLLAVEEIEKRLSDLKSRILNQSKSMGHAESPTKVTVFSTEEQEALYRVTKRLKGLEKSLEGR